MADDEDVVFENSPLYTYLKETGFTDADVCPEPTANSRKDKNCSKSSRNWLKQVHRCIQETITARISLSGNDSVYMERAFAAELLKQVTSSSALVEEDEAVLQNLLTDFVKKEPQVATKSALKPSLPFIKRKLLAVGLICGLSPLLLHPIWSICIPLLAFSAMCTFSAVYRRHNSDTFHNCRQELCDFMSDAERFCKLMKKAVRWIQEMELMSRGFTTVDNLSAVSRLERANLQTSQRRCPELRLITFQTARTVMLICRSATVKLLKKHIIDNALLNSASFLSTSELHDYGPCVTLSDGCDELKLATDNYCVTAIKAMVQLCRIHLSEFLRAVVFVYLMPQGDKRLYAGFHDLSTELHSQHCELRDPFQSLSRCFALHDCVPVKREDVGRMEWQPESHTHNAAVYTTVHSLRLHLQAALIRIHDLEVKLEPLCEDIHPLPFELRDEITSDLNVVKGNITACNDCWDTINQLNEVDDNVVDKATTQPDIDVPDDMTSAETSTKEVISLVDMTEPTLQDQVFEVYTNPETVHPTSNQSSQVVTDDEKEKHDREKLEAKRVLGELKRVIAVRSVERERMLNASIPLNEVSINTTSSTDDKTISSHIPQVNEPSSESRLSFGLFGTINMNANSDLKMPKVCANSELYSDEDDVDSADLSDDDSFDVSLSVTQPGSAQMPATKSDTTNIQNEAFVPVVCPAPAELSLSASIAAMAVARSKQMAALSVDTFGDDSSSDDGEDV